MTYQLEQLLATHAARLQALLPPGWPIPLDMPRRAWGEDFVVYELGQLPDGRHAKLHHFLRADQGPPHCHFCEIESHGLKGDYVERIYKNGLTWDVRRPASGHHVIAADTVHRLVSLPDGDAWTVCFTGLAVREGHHHAEIVELPEAKYFLLEVA